MRASNIPAPLIELKRKSLLLRRLARQLKQELTKEPSK